MAVPAALAAHYQQLLGLVKPWKITDITLDVARERLDIALEWPQGQKAPCPECGKRCGLKDHLPERTWRCLDSMQFKTFLHRCIPRSVCSTHGVQTITAPWAESGSQWTLMFEAFAVIMPEDMDLPVETVTNDCGYYSTTTVTELSEIIPRVNIPERKKDRNLDSLPDEQREAVLAARAVNSSDEGKQLLRERGMHVERSFAHILDCGGMRRTTLRGEENIQKRYNIAAFGYNLSLLMRVLFGCGTLKQWLAGARNACISLFSGILAFIIAIVVPQRLHPGLRTTALVGMDI